MSKETRNEAYAEAGDTAELGPTLAKIHLRSLLYEWEDKIGRKSLLRERVPLVLTAFLHTIIDLDQLRHFEQIEEPKEHYFHALRVATKEIVDPLSDSKNNVSLN